MNEKEEAEFREIHRVLTEAYRQVVSLYPVKTPISSDTAFAIGEAAGILSKAKALMGRDIDVLRKS